MFTRPSEELNPELLLGRNCLCLGKYKKSFGVKSVILEGLGSADNTVKEKAKSVPC